MVGLRNINISMGFVWARLGGDSPSQLFFFPALGSYSTLPNRNKCASFFYVNLYFFYNDQGSFLNRWLVVSAWAGCCAGLLKVTICIIFHINWWKLWTCILQSMFQKQVLLVIISISVNKLMTSMTKQWQYFLSLSFINFFMLSMWPQGKFPLTSPTYLGIR